MKPAGPFPAARRAHVLRWLAAIALAAGAGWLYLATLLPGVGYHADTVRFQFVPGLAAIPHGTGYPVYLLLNDLFTSLLPWGSLAWRANLLSAVFGACAVAVVFRVARRLGARAWLAWGGALLFGLTPTFWSQAVVAEVYTLQALFQALVLSAALRFTGGKRDADFRWATALFALSMANHPASITQLPALAWLLLTALTRRGSDTPATPKRRPARGAPGGLGWRHVLWAAGCALLLGLLPYGLLIARSRSPELAYAAGLARDLPELLALISGGPNRGRMMAFGPGELLGERLPLFAAFLGRELAWLLPLGLLGFLLTLRACRGTPEGTRGGAGSRDRTVAVGLLLSFLAPLLFALGYDIPDIENYFIPSVLILCLWLVTGAEGLLRRMGPAIASPPWRFVVPALLALLPLSQAWRVWDQVDRSGDVAIAREVEAALDLAGEDALVLPPIRPYVRAVQYYLLGEGRAVNDLWTTFPPTAATDYLAGASIPLDHQPGSVPPGLAVYLLRPTAREELHEQGLGTLLVENREASLLRVVAGPGDIPQAVDHLGRRHGGASAFDPIRSRLVLLSPGFPSARQRELLRTPPDPSGRTLGTIDRVAGRTVRGERQGTKGGPLTIQRTMGGLLVEGWAGFPAGGSPPIAIVLRLDGVLALAETGWHRESVAAALGRPELRQAGFRAALTWPEEGPEDAEASGGGSELEGAGGSVEPRPSEHRLVAFAWFAAEGDRPARLRRIGPPVRFRIAPDEPASADS